MCQDEAVLMIERITHVYKLVLGQLIPQFEHVWYIGLVGRILPHCIVCTY